MIMVNLPWCYALADLGAGSANGHGAVGVHLHRDQVCGRRGGVVLQVTQV